MWANIRCRCLELLSAGALSPSYLAGGRDVFGAYLRGGSVCVCPVFSCLVIWRDPRWAENGEPRLLLLSLLCVPFRFLPLLPGAGHRAVCVSLSGLSHAGKLRTDTARLGTGVTPARCAGARGRPPAMAVRWIRPLRQAHPARPRSVSRRRRAHFGPGPCASPVSRVPFPPPPPFRDLGLEIGKQARRCAEGLTSLSGEVTLKGSPY